MRGPKNIRTPANIALAAELKKQGLTHAEIARVFGLRGSIIIRTWLEPQYAEKRREVSRNWRLRNRFGGGRSAPCRGQALKRDAARLIDQLPRDSRDLTARLCGDPLPGRSALDMKLGKYEVPFQ